MPIAWNEDNLEDLPTIEKNLQEILREILLEAPKRPKPTVSLAQSWHRNIYNGVALPVAYYAGEIRDSDPLYPELIDYEVVVGGRRGVPSEKVPSELASFEAALQERVDRLDLVLPVGHDSETKDLRAILALCAYAHGEWVRIHPFANGNGRTARLWVNWCAVRYGLPAFIRLKPRPEGIRYARAAAQSMIGDHSLMIDELLVMLTLALLG
ncbi:MAG: Fic family protein [Thermoanaerobaculia bacterium]